MADPFLNNGEEGPEPKGDIHARNVIHGVFIPPDMAILDKHILENR
jgi:hypothetical protein